MINILHNISWMELSTRFKDLILKKERKRKQKRPEEGVDTVKTVDTEAKHFPSKCLVLALLLVLSSTLATLKHYCKGLLCMWDINFHSKLSLLSFGIELTFSLKNIFVMCNTVRYHRRADVLNGFILIHQFYFSMKSTVVSWTTGFLPVSELRIISEKCNDVIQTQS